MNKSFVMCLILSFSSLAYAQSQGWQADQDASGFNLGNLGTFASGQSSPDPGAQCTVSLSQNSGTYFTIDNTNSGVNAAAGFIASATGNVAIGPYASFFVVGGAFTGLPNVPPGSGLFQHVGDISHPTQTMMFVERSSGQMHFAFGDSYVDAMVLDASSGLTITPDAGVGTRCAQFSSTGLLGPATGACGTGAGTVTTVTGTPPIFITSTPTTTPNVTIQGALVSGSTSTTAQNLGAIATAPLGCSTSGGVCTVDGLTLAGGLHFDAGTGSETLANMTCGSNTFVSSATTSSGLQCTQPEFSNLSGSATCPQLPALTGDVTTSAGSCATAIPTKGKVLVSATDPTIDYLETKFESTSGNIAVTHISGPPEFVNLNVLTAGLFDGPQTASVSANYFSYAPVTTGYGTFAIPYSTARSISDIQNSAMEVPVGFAATKQRVIANVTSNSLSSSGGGSTSTSCQSTQNGSGTSVFAGGVGGIPNTSTGLFDSGVQSVSSSSATDTWGIECGGTSPLSGTITFTITVMLWR